MLYLITNFFYFWAKWVISHYDPENWTIVINNIALNQQERQLNLACQKYVFLKISIALPSRKSCEQTNKPVQLFQMWPDIELKKWQNLFSASTAAHHDFRQIWRHFQLTSSFRFRSCSPRVYRKWRFEGTNLSWCHPRRNHRDLHTWIQPCSRHSMGLEEPRKRYSSVQQLDNGKRGLTRPEIKIVK